MPRRYHAESYQPAPNWVSLNKMFYSALAPRAVSILQPTGFYKKYDIEIDLTVGARVLEGEERAAIERIARALAVTAQGAHGTPSGVVRVWLEKIAREPALFRSKGLPPEAFFAVVANYRRDIEKPGTHLQDVFGRRRVRFEATARRPSARNIARAARRALEHQRRERGRPRNIANRVLAEDLASAFKEWGGCIVRQQTPIDKPGGGVRYVESGSFHAFLENLIGPLQSHLSLFRLAPVTLETIERIAIEQFA